MGPDELRQILKEELKPVIETQKEQAQTLAEHGKILEDHSGKLDSLSQKQDEQGNKLDFVSQKQDKQAKRLDSLSVKSDDIIGELHQVHKLTDGTFEVVAARYEKNKREIDEIKDHLGLPKEPYFGESN